MGRPKGRNTEPTSFSLNTKVIERIKAYHKFSNVPKTKIVEVAVTQYLDSLNFMVEKDSEEVH